jgi:TldD protein
MNAAPRAAGRLLYFESREDLSIDCRPGEEPTITHTSARGLCLDDRAGRPQLVYMSSVSPDAFPPWPKWEPPDAGAPVVARLLETSCRAVGTETLRVRWVSSVQDVFIGREDGVVLGDRRSGWRIRLDAGSATVELACGGPPPDPADPRLTQMAATLRATVERRAECVPPTLGPTTVVLAPGAAGVWVHEVFGHALEADTFAAGRSWLGRADAPIPQDILICDDPRRCRTPISIDDEGTPTATVILVEGGRVATCLHDRASAKRASHRPTGSARRASFRDPVLPRMSCTFIESGTLSRGQILSTVSEGIHVRRMEAGAVDPFRGRATFRVTDAERIHRGAIGDALEPHVLEIQARLGFPGLLVGDDLEFDASPGSCHRDGQTLITSVGAPTVCLGMVGVVR